MESTWFTDATEPSAVGREARDVDWESTPLGPPSGWSTALRHVVRLCFSTRFPVMLVWGPDLTLIYNDGYRDMLGTLKHPAALGAPARVVWGEIWDDVGPLFDSVLRTGLPTWTEDMVLHMNRSGFVEETMFTFSYSPLLDDDGTVAGVLDIATETTVQVRTRRRLAALDGLHVAVPTTYDDIGAFAGSVMSALAASSDISRAAFYGAEHGNVELVAESAPPRSSVAERALLDDALRHRQFVVDGTTAVAPLRGAEGDGAAGVLVLEANPSQPMDREYVQFLSVVCSTISSGLRGALTQRRALDSLRRRAERSEEETVRARETSLALQNAALAAPPQPEGLEIAVLYRPASDERAIGGDWYDAFLTRDGATMLVVGDVVGHDLPAAAAMMQVRGLVRAIGYDTGGAPADVLARTDDAVRGLALGESATATVVAARVDPAQDPGGARTLRWSSAGHLPPLLLRADGTAELVWRRSDLPLGLVPDLPRTEHALTLHYGDTVLLYTDGLVERRDVGLRERLDELVRTVTGAPPDDLDHFARALLDTLQPAGREDDVAVVALRVSAGPPPGVPHGGL
ncbi:PP2C family protein-serine/threonine phosphatase [Cellulosimicrobium marinum]|uniref:PP2C family protein-serine/threonine phosphatase n=1 Tax=Cellulosimicrobium marinum TaxID=1638992 RepID=UPI001E439D72|nr:PP2C family protein-serine/threonine phosphatase [Cellulosimicrobium marinum]MCB7135846.1 serine/threonine-protein phosphatase [Cellulosimicrobium marinum]